MKQILQTHLGKALLCLLMVVLGGSNAWGDDFSTIYSYGQDTWTRTGFEDAGDYYRSSSSQDCIASINGIFTGKAITSNVVITLNVATYGSGDNPTANKFSIYNSSECTTNVTAAQAGTLPSSSTYRNPTYTITQANATANFTDDLAIKIASGTKLIRLKSITVEFTYSPVASSAVATTTTINASGITNTDVYLGTTAGSLSATVKDASSNNVAGAAVTWSGDNDAVATINETTGAVTLVKAGSVTFTASYAGVNDEYLPSSATYEMTVTSSAPYVQPTEFDIALNNALFGTSYSGTAAGITDDAPVIGSQDNVIVTYAGSSNHYVNDSQIRFYPNNKLTFEAPDGYNITKIVFTSGGTWSATISADCGTYTSGTKTWTGEATSVLFTGSGSGRCDMSKVAITLAKESSVAKPTFSVAEGTYYEVKNVTVSNYDDDYMYFYTTDGTAPACDSNLNPEGTSQAYDHATGIDITATTTLKMIAVDSDANSSNVASATYTFPTVYTSIADFKTANTTGYLNLTGAQVVYIDGDKKNIYVRDASGAIDLYNNSGFSTSLTTGDILSGIIYGTYSPYKNLPEITSIEDISALTATENETVVAKVIDGTTAAIAANLCDLVKIDNTEISESSSKYYVGDNNDIQLFDNFSVGYTVTTGKAVDVSGIATVYNTTYEIFPRYESDIVYLDNAVEVSISAAGYATFCSDKALDFTGTDAIEVYYGTLAGDKLTFSRIYKVPANTGVLLRSALGGAVAATNVPVLDGTADDVTGNCLTGVTEATTLNANDYILNVVNGGAGFYKAGEYTDLAANRAYIPALVGGGIKSFGINLTTGIDLPATEKAEKVIFDLSGRRVEKPAKGLYIVNGKKVLF